MREWRVRRVLNEDSLRVTINPQRILYHTKTYGYQNQIMKLNGIPYIPIRMRSTLAKLLWEFRGFTIKESSIKRAPIEQGSTFLRMKDVSDHRHSLRSSRTFSEIALSIDSIGEFRHKNYTLRTSDEIGKCIRACFLDIVTSMENEGYNKERKTEFGTGGIGDAFIDKDGTLLKASGASHRLAAAKIAGLQDGFPLRIIGAHNEWLRREKIYGSGCYQRLYQAIRSLEQVNSAPL